MTYLLIGGSLLFNVLFCILIFSHWGIFRPALGDVVKAHPPVFKVADAIRDRLTQQETPEETEARLREIEQLINIIAEDIAQFSSETDRLDYIRNFVYTYSIHQGGEEYAWHTPTVLAMMYQFYTTQENPPHLTCGSRALTMKAILDKLGKENRVVMIFSDNFSRVRSHTFLEVWNQQTQRWEIQDPDLNIFYQNTATLSRASTLELVLGQIEHFEPCSSETSCGWEAHDLKRLVDNRRFGAVMYDQRNHLERQIFNTTPVYESSVIVVNTDRFSVTKPFPVDDGMNFIQFANAHYGNPVFIFNQPFRIKTNIIIGF